MQKEINFYQEMASEHRLQEYSKGSVPLCYLNMSPFHYRNKFSLFCWLKKGFSKMGTHN